MTGIVKVEAHFDADNMRKLQKRLNEIKPGLRAEMLREAKKVAKPLAASLKVSNSRIKPLGGMMNPGPNRRLVWNTMSPKGWGTVRPEDVKVQFRTGGSKKTNVTSLLRLAIPHPLMAIAQYAGRSGRSINKGYKGSGRTRVYKWRTRVDGVLVERQHEINGQGRKMINAWHTQGRAYKAVEHAMPQARIELQKVITHYEKIASDR